MAHLIPSSFSFYDLTEEEELQGQILTVTQAHVIQNQLATCAEEKLMIKFTPESQQQFVQEDSYKQGQIDILKYILTMSETGIELRAERANNPPEDNEV
tara:strand:+ start:10101 stop:10397 length:297 start_codon:yes stop_codon:yes gene_type:complete